VPGHRPTFVGGCQDTDTRSTSNGRSRLINPNEIPDLFVSSLVLAGSYTLLGLSWVITFRATRVLNVAVGQFMALGAFVYYFLYVELHLPFLLALPLTLAALAGFAGLTFHIFVRPLHGQPHFVVVVLTIGWSIIIGGFISIVWGQDLRVLPLPIPNHAYTLPTGAHVSTYGVATVVAAVLLSGALILFFQFSRVGIRMRGAAELPVLASQSGVNITILFFIAWALAGIATALAGISYGYTNVVTPAIAAVGIRGLTPALIGGFESLPGTIIGAVLVAFIQVLGVRILGGDADDAVVSAVLLFFLMVRPYGILGQAEVRRV
jgi:branched-chain amino acid transport system permease protein